jgi:hypothetical protein
MNMAEYVVKDSFGNREWTKSYKKAKEIVKKKVEAGFGPCRIINVAKQSTQSPRSWANWLKKGGGVWSTTELAGIVLNRGSEATDYTFRMGPPFPMEMRKAAQQRLRVRVKKGSPESDMVTQALALRLARKSAKLPATRARQGRRA